MRKLNTVFLCTGLFLLSACGGGGGTEAPPTAPPPPVTPPPTNPPPAPTPDPVPDPDPVSTPEEMRVDAARLLAQATFGPTMDEIEYVVEKGTEVWLDEQFALPITSAATTLGVIDDQRPADEDELSRRHRVNAWWQQVIEGDDQLRQRVAFALSQIMVVSERSNFFDDYYGLANYYDLLLTHSFGNFRDLLEAVTRSPIMGMYLSMLGNEKPDAERNIRPDENYARELMQLFSIGLVELNADGSVKLGPDNQPIPTYDQDVIEHYAHVFTGWNFAPTTANTWYKWWRNYDTDNPMKAIEEFHDKGEKMLLGDVIVPANQSAYDDLDMALDSLFFHDNVGPFIGKQLIQRLVTSNPSEAYVGRVSEVFADNGFGVRGDMQAVIRAILLDEEARKVHDPDHEFGKLREPLIKFAHMVRALDAAQGNGEFDFGYPDYFSNQAPLASPSVFNFFSPSYSATDALTSQGLVAPELQIMTATYVVRTTNFFAYTALWAHSDEDAKPEDLQIDYSAEIAMLDDPDAFIEHVNLLFLAGSMSANMKVALLDVLAETEFWKPADRVANIMFLVLSSPQYAVQK